MKRFVAVFLSVLLLLGTLAGCGSKEAGSSGEGKKEYKIGFIAAGKFGDKSLNDVAHEGILQFEKESGIKVTCVELSEFSDNAVNAKNFGEQGYDLVIMIDTVSEVMADIVGLYPNTRFVINKGTIEAPNVTCIQYDEAQAGFLTGAFAVLMSKELNGSNQVGWIGGLRIPVLESSKYAFKAGAKYFGGEVVDAYIGSFEDVAKGKELALQMYGSGMSIIQAYAGGASNGVYQAVETLGQGNYALGCATGQYDLSPERILASQVIKTDEYMKKICEDFVAGKLEVGTQLVQLGDGGVGIKYSPFIGDRIPQSVIDAVSQVEQKIIQGEIKVPMTEEEFNAFTQTA